MLYVDKQFYIINYQNLVKQVRLNMDAKISSQSLLGTINQNVYRGRVKKNMDLSIFGSVGGSG